MGDLIVLEGLLDLSHTIIVPERVEEEVRGINEIDLAHRCEVRAADRATFDEISARYFRLGSGEKAVLALGKECEADGVEYVCVVDDMRAREACDTESLEYTGQIGLVNLLIEAGSISREEAIRILQRMDDAGSWLPPDWRTLVGGGE